MCRGCGPEEQYSKSPWRVRLGEAHVSVCSDFLPCRILVHLSRGGAKVQIFAPDVPQMHVVDHAKGQPSEGETRYRPYSWPWTCPPAGGSSPGACQQPLHPSWGRVLS